MNTYTLSISSTKYYKRETTLNQIDLFDTTKVTLDISNIYTELFPSYLSISWGDGTDPIHPILEFLETIELNLFFQNLPKV